MSVVFPRPLRKGDRIAIVSPSSKIDPDVVAGAVPVLRNQGWEPVVYPHALDVCGSYAGSRADRLSDLEKAFADPSVRAILCSRGGYGAVHLLSSIDSELITSDPKWVIGFSDISAIHAFMSIHGIASIHSSMCRHLRDTEGLDCDSQSLFQILRGEKPSYCVEPHKWNREGYAVGPLVGGNLAVLSALIGTPYNMIGRKGSILFIEDIAEPIYKVERILWQMRLAGVFESINGLIVGQFTEYRQDYNYSDMTEMIHDMTSDLNIPVVYDFPVGHVEHNLPLIESAVACLRVTGCATCLSF